MLRAGVSLGGDPTWQGTVDLWEQWQDWVISALCRAGRRGEALEAYQDLYRILKRELGLEPSPELQRLQARILDSTVTELPRQPSRLPEPRSAPYGTPPFWTSTAAGRPQGRRGARFPRRAKKPMRARDGGTGPHQWCAPRSSVS
ncbi:BTAD domain-containing putative transcriptional regulator [Streptomyces achromogenes]|uniref:BTAD domain-containing putative transcriptional regulator n=1 Tax=Streptomyces achromogenes TaxID=67255 RepID=UPI0036AE62E5